MSIDDPGCGGSMNIPYSVRTIKFVDNSIQLYFGTRRDRLNQQLGPYGKNVREWFETQDIEFCVTEFSMGHIVFKIKDPEQFVMLKLTLDMNTLDEIITKFVDSQIMKSMMIR